MFGTILAVITALGPSVLHLGDKIAELKIKKMSTESEREKNQIDQQIQETNARRDVLVAEAGDRVALIMKGIARGAVLLVPLSILIKMGPWDKVVGSFYGCAGKFAADHMSDCYKFVTDPIDVHIWWVLSAALAFYFVYDVTAIARRK